MDPLVRTRRQVMGLAGLAAVGGLAGCSEGSDGDGGDGDGGDGDGGDGDGGDGGYGGGGADGDSEDSDETDGTAGSADADGDSPTATETTVTETSTETPKTDELDLREANVVGVEFESTGDRSYDFDVTLHHDDDGEEGYANWWQVERLDGTRLGRRDLSHAHSRQPFTRSTTVDVPSDVTCVVVRGHDQTHGYGGRTVLANVETGDTSGVLQGSESETFDSDDCP